MSRTVNIALYLAIPSLALLALARKIDLVAEGFKRADVVGELKRLYLALVLAGSNATRTTMAILGFSPWRRNALSTMALSADDLMWEFFQGHPMKPATESKL